MRTFIIVMTVATGVVLLLVWGVVRDTMGRPYQVDRAALSGWIVVPGAPGDPWIVALQPPASLTTSLFQQVTAKTGRPLVAPTHAALPLVMRPEYDDALQGVYGAADIERMATQERIGEALLEPVCIGHRVDSQSGGSRELYFLAVHSAPFTALRLSLRPDFPEHAGIGVYEPGALTPVLPIAATDADLARWWPLRFDRITDCQAPVTVE